MIEQLCEISVSELVRGDASTKSHETNALSEAGQFAVQRRVNAAVAQGPVNQTMAQHNKMRHYRYECQPRS